MESITKKSSKSILIQHASGSFVPLLDFAEPLHKQYCDRCGMDYWCIRDGKKHENGVMWERYIYIQKALDEGYEFIVYMDADALITDFQVDVRTVLDGTRAWLGMTADLEHNWYQAGIQFIKATDRAKEFYRTLPLKYGGEKNDEIAINKAVNDLGFAYADVMGVPSYWHSIKCKSGPHKSWAKAYHTEGDAAHRLELMKDAWKWYEAEMTGKIKPVAVYCGDCGLGDLLMTIGAMGAAYDRDPSIIFEVYTIRFAEVFWGLPFVSSVHISPPPVIAKRIVQIDPSDDPMRGRLATAYRILEVADLPIEKRSMRYHLDDDARWNGINKLWQSGWNGEKKVVGIQMHGGWQQKRWAHSLALARECQLQGLFPVMVGQANMHGFTKPLLEDGIPFITSLDNCRQLAGLQSYMSAWVGFDSGGSFLAAAIGIPTVWLYTAHNPNYLIAKAGANAPFRILWPNWVASCASRGRTCRTDIYPDVGGSNGDVCPYQVMGGAKCIDTVSVEDVMRHVNELLGL